MNPDISTDPWVRLLQIFSAKLVLEVFGGAGAIWGFSEVCTLRNQETQEFWRKVALSVGFVFFVRFILQIRDYLAEVKGTSTPIKEGTLLRLLQIFSARLVLEVFGGGGAIWGFSEATTLRVPETQEFWRYNASVVAIFFACRFYLQIRDYVNEHHMLDGDETVRRGFQIFAAKLVLEVFGGGGAIWGFSEVLTLRRPETQETWRFNALVIAFVFFIRFLLQIKDYVNKVDYDSLEHDKTIRGLQIFSARLVLEVFGGGGAIWGFSEATTLRCPETQEFWRTNAQIVGAIFFVRFLLQISDYIRDREVTLVPKGLDIADAENAPLTATF